MKLFVIQEFVKYHDLDLCLKSEETSLSFASSHYKDKKPLIMFNASLYEIMEAIKETDLTLEAYNGAIHLFDRDCNAEVGFLVEG